eukprot:jgi/Botrbrau1/3509/Bobra.341_2s0038.1
MPGVSHLQCIDVCRNAITSASTGNIDTGVQFQTSGYNSGPTAVPSSSPAATVENTPAPTSPVPTEPPAPTAAPTSSPLPAAVPASPVPTAAPTPTPVPVPAVPPLPPVNVAAPAVLPGPAVGGTANAPAPSACQTIGQILQSNPQVSDWYQALQTNGQATQLNNPTLQLTMFAPTNAALRAPLSAVAGTQNISTDLENVGSVSNLLSIRPGIRTPIIGYHVVPGNFPSAALTPGASFTTTDIIRAPGQPDIPLRLNISAPATVRFNIQLRCHGQLHG